MKEGLAGGKESVNMCKTTKPTEITPHQSHSHGHLLLPPLPSSPQLPPKLLPTYLVVCSRVVPAQPE